MKRQEEIGKKDTTVTGNKVFFLLLFLFSKRKRREIVSKGIKL